MEVGVDKPTMGAGALEETFGCCHAWKCSIYTKFILRVFDASDTLSKDFKALKTFLFDVGRRGRGEDGEFTGAKILS